MAERDGGKKFENGTSQQSLMGGYDRETLTAQLAYVSARRLAAGPARSREDIALSRDPERERVLREASWKRAEGEPFQARVEEFHRTFDVAVSDVPTVQSGDVAQLRINLIREEAEELCAALKAGDLVGIADGIADLHYVTSGTAVSYGIPEEKVFAEVHRSNMSKLWADGLVHRREDGKIIKPPTYSPADIVSVLALVRADREIAQAVEYAGKPHSQAEHIGALLGEMDWRSEKARLLGEPGPRVKSVPAAVKVDVGGFGY